MTAADVASDAIIRKDLESPFPIVDEEGEGAAATASSAEGQTWVWIDPLDATREFSEGLDQYVSIMACLVHEKSPIAGIVYFPFRKGCVSDRHDDAEAGGCMFGAYLNPGTGGWVERHDSAQAEPEVPDRSAATLPVVILSRTSHHQGAGFCPMSGGRGRWRGFKIVEV